MTQTVDDTEDSLEYLFGRRMLHRDSAVKEIVPDQKEDIDRYVQWGKVDERPRVATEMRTKHLALQLDNKQRLERSLRVLLYH